MKIERNRIQCLNCLDFIESVDAEAKPVWCSCGQVGVAGGLEQLKRYSEDTHSYKELSQYEYDHPHDVEFM